MKAMRKGVGLTSTLKLTRRGWIDHLAIVQEMLENLRCIYATPTHRSVMGPKDCETVRRDKIEKEFLKLQELLWETSAVSEKILREEAKEGRLEVDELEGVCVEPWSDSDVAAESEAREEYARAAKDLEARARSLWDKDAPEVVEAEVVYPGGEGRDETQPPKPEEADPRQQTFDFQADPSRLVDCKMLQAHDDTTTPEDGE